MPTTILIEHQRHQPLFQRQTSFLTSIKMFLHPIFFLVLFLDSATPAALSPRNCSRRCANPRRDPKPQRPLRQRDDQQQPHRYRPNPPLQQHLKPNLVQHPHHRLRLPRRRRECCKRPIHHRHRDLPARSPPRRSKNLQCAFRAACGFQ